MELCGREIKLAGRLVRMARIGAEKYLFLEDPVPLLDAAKTCGTRIDIFTFMQRPPDTDPKYSYPMEMDNLAVLPVTTFENWWNNQIRSLPRNRARQAEKRGVVLRVTPFSEELVRGIWEIYNEVPIRQGRRFPHFGKDLDTVRKEEATHPDRSVFIGAYLADRLIGFVRLLIDETKTTAGLLNILSLMSQKEKAPTNALIAHSVRWCADHGIPYLTYSNFAYGRRERDTLADFKENNGFRRLDLPRYYVPLTPLGRAALSLGLHRPWIEMIPGPVWLRLRELRKAWYDRSTQPLAKLPQESGSCQE